MAGYGGGPARLKTKYIISPLSNGNVALLTNMAKFAGLPWDLVMSAELFQHYKPDPETYLGAAKLLCLAPEEVMMCAAHNNDLKAAQKLGLKTAFVPRPTEYGPHQKYDFEARGAGTSSPRILAGLPIRWGVSAILRYCGSVARKQWRGPAAPSRNRSPASVGRGLGQGRSTCCWLLARAAPQQGSA